MSSENQKTMERRNRIIFKPIYSLLSLITERIRISWLIRLKILIGLSLLANKTAYSQTQTTVFPSKENQIDTLKLNVDIESESITLCYEVVVVNYRSVEPKFLGGQRALNRFVRENVIYPKSAIENSIEGELAVNITIDTIGNVQNALVIQGLGYGLDEEALRLAKILPKFKPGKANKRIITSNTTIIFHFELPKK